MIENLLNPKALAKDMKKIIPILFFILLLPFAVQSASVNVATNQMWFASGGNSLIGDNYQFSTGNFAQNSTLNIVNNTVIGMEFQPLVADLDSDGVSEIIVFDAGKIYALDSSLAIKDELSLAGSPTIASAPAVSFWYEANDTQPYVVAILYNNSQRSYFYMSFTYDGADFSVVQAENITSVAYNDSSHRGVSGIRCSSAFVVGGIQSEQTFDADDDGLADCLFYTWNATLIGLDSDSPLASATIKHFLPDYSVLGDGADRNLYTKHDRIQAGSSGGLNRFTAPSMADIENDGDMDVAWGRCAEIYVIDENDNEIFFKNMSDLPSAWKCSVSLTPYWDAYPMFVQADSNSASDREIIAQVNERRGSTSGTSIITLFESNGVVRWGEFCTDSFGAPTIDCDWSLPIYQEISSTSFNYDGSGYPLSSPRTDFFVAGDTSAGAIESDYKISGSSAPLLSIDGTGTFINTEFMATALLTEGGLSNNPHIYPHADMDNDGNSDIIHPMGLYTPEGELWRFYDAGDLSSGTPAFQEGQAIIPVDIDGDFTLDLLFSKDGRTTAIKSSALPSINGTLIGLACPNFFNRSNPELFCEPFSYSDSILNHFQPLSTSSNFQWKGADLSPNGFELDVTGQANNNNYHALFDKDTSLGISGTRTPIITMSFRMNKFSAKSQEDLLILNDRSPVQITDISWRDGFIYSLNSNNASITSLTDYTNNTYYDYSLLFYLNNDTYTFKQDYTNGTNRFTKGELAFINPDNKLTWFVFEWDNVGSTSGSNIKLDEIYVYRGKNITILDGVSEFPTPIDADCFNQDGIDICKYPDYQKPSNQTCLEYHTGGEYESSWNWALCDEHEYCNVDNSQCTTIEPVKCGDLCPLKVIAKHRGQDFIWYLFTGGNMIIFLGFLVLLFIGSYFLLGTNAGRTTINVIRRRKG